MTTKPPTDNVISLVATTANDNTADTNGPIQGFHEELLDLVDKYSNSLNVAETIGIIELVKLHVMIE